LNRCDYIRATEARNSGVDTPVLGNPRQPWAFANIFKSFTTTR